MKLFNNQQVDLGVLIYEGECQKCGEILDFECDFDADGSTYHAHCCGLSYHASPATYNVSVGEDE